MSGPRLTGAALALMLLLALSACADGDYLPTDEERASAPDALVVVAGVHQGMPAADLPVEVEGVVTSAVAGGAPVTVIANDGTPAVVFRAAGYPINEDNPEAHTNSINRVLVPVLAAIREAAADADGNDLAGSLAVAADVLDASGARRGAVIVVDNGLSDRGYPALTTPGLLDADRGAEVVQWGQDQGALLSLPPGTTVHLVGLGYTTMPQEDLTPAQREILISTWRAVLEAAGAQVELVTVPRAGPGPDTTYSTTPVEPGSYDQLVIETTAAQTSVTLKSMTFDPDSPVLTDAARAALHEVVDLIAASTGDVVITGHTDVGPTTYPGGNVGLSTDRAEALEAWLVTQGVDAGRIRATGAGDADPVFPDPNTEAEREANRRVVITFLR